MAEGVGQKGRRARRQSMATARACKFFRQKTTQRPAPVGVRVRKTDLEACASAVQALCKHCASCVQARYFRVQAVLFGIAERVGFPHFLSCEAPPECPLYNIKRDHQFENGHFSLVSPSARLVFRILPPPHLPRLSTSKILPRVPPVLGALPRAPPVLQGPGPPCVRRPPAPRGQT